jgi:hypothetical protein
MEKTEEQIEIVRSNDETVRRILFGFWAALEYIIDEQRGTRVEVSTADVGRAVFAMVERFARVTVKEKADAGDVNAHINAAAVKQWLGQIQQEIESWPLPPLPDEAVTTDGE